MSSSNIRSFSLAAMQGLNHQIYCIQNDRNYSASKMVSRIHRYTTRILKAVRKNKTEGFDYYLAMAFSWSMALGNRLHINIDEELWTRFPGVCPYCTSPVCSCKERAAERTEVKPAINRPTTLQGYQEMFSRIYSHNTLQDAAMHLAEEIGEVDEAIEHYSGTHDPQLFKEITVELVDAVTNMFAVATALKINLAVEIESNFSGGCPKCNCRPCQCGYVVVKTM